MKIERVVKKSIFQSILVFCLVHVYGTTTCPHCKLAINFLRGCGVKFVFHDIRNQLEHISLALLMEEKDKIARTVPQIFICDEHIGGNSDMASLHKSGELGKKFLEHGIKSLCKQGV